ncbi:MAG: hypothetical protein ABIQ52_08125 [Vicinamibacterales bacterium]
MLEAIDLLKRLKQGFLNNVRCIGEVARPAREPPAGPPAQARDISSEQLVERVAVAGPKAGEQVNGGVHVLG